MNETAKQETVKVIQGVFVFNCHLVHPTFLDIIELALDNENEHELQAIFFSERKSAVEDYGWYVPELDAVVMNLPNTLAKTIKGLQENQTGLSLAGGLWMNMIWTFFHELHHAVAWAVDAEACEANRDGQEDEAQAYAEEMLGIVAGDGMADAPALEDMPWFSEYGPAAMRCVDPAFQAKQAEMVEKGLLFDHSGAQMTSMKDYFKEAQAGIEETENDAVELELKVEADKAGGQVATAQPMEQLMLPVAGEDGTCYDMPDEDGTLDEAYAHIEKDMADPNFKGIPGTSGTASAGIDPVEYAKHLEAGGNAGNFKAEVAQRPVREAAVKMWMMLYNYLFNVGGVWADMKIPIPPEVAALGFVTGSRDASGQWIQSNTGYVVGRYFKDGALKGFDIGVNAGGVRKVFRLIEQNTKTGSSYALRAAQGEKIAWLIDTSVQDGSKAAWIAKIDQGKYERL